MRQRDPSEAVPQSAELPGEGGLRQRYSGHAHHKPHLSGDEPAPNSC